MAKPFYIPEHPHIDRLYTVFRRDCSKTFFFKGESHDFWELVCVLEGEVGIATDRQVFTLRQGEAILHPPMQFHSLYSSGGTEPSVIIFSFSGNNIPSIYDAICRIDDLSQVKALHELAMQAFDFKHEIHIDAIKQDDGKCLQFVKLLELLLVSLSHPSRQSVTSQSAENYAVIMQTLHQNIDRRLTVAELSELCRMSPINLQKTFSRYAGVSVMAYFSRIKMQKGIQLLQQGMSVKEAALSLGYKDQNYFSTAFKHIVGKPPTEAAKSSNRKQSKFTPL